MKNFAFVLLVLGVTTSLFSQINEDIVYETQWRLRGAITVDGVIYNKPNNAAVGSVPIVFNEATPHLVTTVCSTLETDITRTPNEFSFIFSNGVNTPPITCVSSEGQIFEEVYFNFFSLHSDEIIEFNISVIDGPPFDELVLSLMAPNGDIIEYTDMMALSINDLDKKSFKIFPNPVSETLFINSNSQSNTQLRLLSVQGAVLIEKYGTSISLEGYSKGVYFLEITNVEGMVQVEKIIKQ